MASTRLLVAPAGQAALLGSGCTLGTAALSFLSGGESVFSGWQGGEGRSPGGSACEEAGGDCEGAASSWGLPESADGQRGREALRQLAESSGRV